MSDTKFTTYPSQDAAVAALITHARSFLGYTEGPDNDNQFGRQYGMNNVAWCDIFRSCMHSDVFGECAMPIGPRSAWVPGTAAVYCSDEQSTTDPQPGDTLCLWSDALDTLVHVGIVTRAAIDGVVRFVSGNTADPNGGASRPPGDEQEGWGVFERDHVLNPRDVIGRPDWAAVVSGGLAEPVAPAAPPRIFPPGLPVLSALGLEGLLHTENPPRPHRSLTVLAQSLNDCGCGPVTGLVAGAPLTVSAALEAAWTHAEHRSGKHSTDGHVDLATLTWVAQDHERDVAAGVADPRRKRFHAAA